MKPLRLLSLACTLIVSVFTLAFLMPHQALATGQWTLTGSMQSPAGIYRLTTLQNGKVLAVNDQGSNVVQLYDPATGQWTRTGDLLVARYGTHLIKLQDGRVLMISGSQWSNGTTECEIYDPATGQWTQTGSTNYVQNGSATLLSDGRVLVAGGNTQQGVLPPSEIYDPSTGMWTVDAFMNDGHNGTDLVALSNGHY
jgi:hypothetical protein